MNIDEVNLKRHSRSHIHSEFQEGNVVQQREKQKIRENIRANPGLHERMTEKDRIRK